MNVATYNNLQHFKAYLKTQQLTASSIKSYHFIVHKFMEWHTQQGYDLQHFDYKVALRYIDHLKTLHQNRKTINSKITATRHYFDYLIATAQIVENPFTELIIRGQKAKKMLHNLLDYNELEDLYYSYPISTYPRKIVQLTSKRNKVILGFMVYQGLSTTDLQRLQIEHLHLQKGKLYVPSGAIGGSRTLDLQPWQIMELIHYVNTIHPEISKLRNINSTALFMTENGRLTDLVRQIIQKAKRINNKLHNIHQIRASVIVYWLSKYNLRQVQVMAGHRRISTTERYQQHDISQLQGVIEKYHPLS